DRKLYNSPASIEQIIKDLLENGFEYQNALNQNVLHQNEKKNGENIPQPLVLTPPTQQEYEDIMNILLLGETGVGKSTFINGFVNYLKYNKLEEAEKNPVVLIPVSFFITTGNDFEEHLVKFEGKDGISGEDHKQIGQSVTQHCKSYAFTLTDNETW
ncbi:unnamed protein product, partial [Rotaria magnacalcarata]